MSHSVHKLGPIPTINTYKNWTYGAYICWKNKCVCENCNQKSICDSIKPIGRIPYGMKPMKFAVLKLSQKFGTEELDEMFGQCDDD